MTRISPYFRLRLRRVAALLAVFGLLYAAGFATLAHGMTLPMTMAPMSMAPMSMAMTMPAAGLPDHDHAAMAAMHDHGAMADPDPAPAPCDSGCSLCKDCALCLFTGLPIQVLPVAAFRYAAYPVVAPDRHTGIRPTLPAEPPRV